MQVWCWRALKQYLKLPFTLKLAATSKLQYWQMIAACFRGDFTFPLYALLWFNSPYLSWDPGCKLNYSFHRSEARQRKGERSSVPVERQACLSVILTSAVLIARTSSVDALDSKQPRKKTATAGCLEKCETQNPASCCSPCYTQLADAEVSVWSPPSSLCFSNMILILTIQGEEYTENLKSSWKTVYSWVWTNVHKIKLTNISVLLPIFLVSHVHQFAHHSKLTST